MGKLPNGFSHYFRKIFCDFLIIFLDLTVPSDRIYSFDKGCYVTFEMFSCMMRARRQDGWMDDVVLRSF